AHHRRQHGRTAPPPHQTTSVPNTPHTSPAINDRAPRDPTRHTTRLTLPHSQHRAKQPISRTDLPVGGAANGPVALPDRQRDLGSAPCSPMSPAGLRRLTGKAELTPTGGNVMRKIVAGMFISLDGVVEAPDQ